MNKDNLIKFVRFLHSLPQTEICSSYTDKCVLYQYYFFDKTTLLYMIREYRPKKERMSIAKYIRNVK